MRNGICKILVCLIALPWVVSTANSTIQCHEPDARMLASIVRVAGDDGSQASGVVVATNLVLTAAHALEDAKSVYVGVDDLYVEAHVILIDPARDLAIMVAPTADLMPIKLAQRELILTEPVWAVGYPLAQDLHTSAGTVQRMLDGDLHTSADINSGHSGGGLLSCDHGNHVLAGMLRGFGAYRSGDNYVRLPNYSVSVAAREIKEFVASAQSTLQ
ncbi:MAG: trypsin-like peptidase domain-containing protein [Gammaproteobacteria bacterium]